MIKYDLLRLKNIKQFETPLLFGDWILNEQIYTPTPYDRTVLTIIWTILIREYGQYYIAYNVNQFYGKFLNVFAEIYNEFLKIREMHTWILQQTPYIDEFLKTSTTREITTLTQSVTSGSNNTSGTVTGTNATTGIITETASGQISKTNIIENLTYSGTPTGGTTILPDNYQNTATKINGSNSDAYNELKTLNRSNEINEQSNNTNTSETLNNSNNESDGISEEISTHIDRKNALDNFKRMLDFLYTRMDEIKFLTDRFKDLFLDLQIRNEYFYINED